jgi:hypothetical protein
LKRKEKAKSTNVQAAFSFETAALTGENVALIFPRLGEILKGDVTAFLEGDQPEIVPIQPVTAPSWSCLSC